MISIGENKASLCKGDFHPATLYKGDKKIAGYSVGDFEGVGIVTLTNCYNDKVYGVQIKGTSETDYESPVTDATITVRGKNLLDLTRLAYNVATESGLTAELYDKDGIRVYGTPTKTGNIILDLGGNAGWYRLNYKAGTVLRMSTPLCSLYDNITGGSKAYHQSSLYENETWVINAQSYGATTLPKDVTKIINSSIVVAVKDTNTYLDFVVRPQLEIGDAATPYEPYIEPQTMPFENGELKGEIPTFKGTTVIEIEADIAATIKGKYKRKEV